MPSLLPMVYYVQGKAQELKNKENAHQALSGKELQTFCHDYL